jgi:hypothetical protein
MVRPFYHVEGIIKTINQSAAREVQMRIKIGMTLFLIMIAAAVFAWKAGNRVLGQWSDGLWYPAKITAQEGADFKVAFDDGDTAVLPAAKIKKINWKVGTKVNCNWKKGGAYYDGTITKMQGEAIHISYNDGDQEDSTISICRSH